MPADKRLSFQTRVANARTKEAVESLLEDYAERLECLALPHARSREIDLQQVKKVGSTGEAGLAPTRVVARSRLLLLLVVVLGVGCWVLGLLGVGGVVCRRSCCLVSLGVVVLVGGFVTLGVVVVLLSLLGVPGAVCYCFLGVFIGCVVFLVFLSVFLGFVVIIVVAHTPFSILPACFRAKALLKQCRTKKKG